MRSPRAFMKTFISRLFLPGVTAGLVLSGVAGGERSASAEEVVTVAPPAPRVELVTAAPSPNHFWIPGYWGYQPGYGHQWYGGRWEANRPGYAWSQPGWGRGGGGWQFRHGGWNRGGGGSLHGGGGVWHGSNGNHGGYHGGGVHGGGHGGGHGGHR
jgi:hypothetical protein